MVIEQPAEPIPCHRVPRYHTRPAPQSMRSEPPAIQLFRSPGAVGLPAPERMGTTTTTSPFAPSPNHQGSFKVDSRHRHLD
jgi:hypothetical protein